ncbi:hypothetical protein K8Z61_18425 [Nocardioides sp. TRM66260-LWL]|uniref:hypothetical protein n=1 Tax=Nocardioides sp. TRM66260-LWL TaxID=2874478 RepID=UPI001CC7DCF7|nr:hypothetical protein [Nocardioides sp. TRM66260-LWL]MBZ5736471.1 hypothetical protein [Nocardioides sp. TRM66260-LWL]
MPRIRSVKPEYWADFTTARLSRDARLLYIALWNFADEHARMAGDPRFVKGQAFPYDDDLSPEAVDCLLDELHDSGNIVRYVAAGAPYIHIPSLHRHQRLEPGKVPSRHPEPPFPPPPGGGTDSSAPRADESAPNSDSQPVDNPSGGTSTESPQVRGQQQIRADKSAPGADESSLLYAAGSREQGAGCMEQAAAAADRETLPDELAILRSKLNTRKLVVRWDRLSADQIDEIRALVALHGDGPLVKTAIQAFQPNNPPVFAQAWLENWRALPAPGDHLAALDDPCPQPGHSGTTRHCPQCAADALADDTTPRKRARR